VHTLNIILGGFDKILLLLYILFLVININNMFRSNQVSSQLSLADALGGRVPIHAVSVSESGLSIVAGRARRELAAAQLRVNSDVVDLLGLARLEGLQLQVSATPRLTRVMFQDDPLLEGANTSEDEVLPNRAILSGFDNGQDGLRSDWAESLADLLRSRLVA
jgi:hypothetical protein